MSNNTDSQNEVLLKGGKVIRRKITIPSQGVQLLKNDVYSNDEWLKGVEGGSGFA